MIVYDLLWKNFYKQDQKILDTAITEEKHPRDMQRLRPYVCARGVCRGRHPSRSDSVLTQMIATG